MYEAIKLIATMYYNKCRKYTKEELTPELQDVLFDEAYEEYCTMESITKR